jgi:hypothetical protein
VQHDAELTPFMVDGDGVVVHHPRKDMMFRSLMPLDPAVQQRIKADQRFRRDRIERWTSPSWPWPCWRKQRSGHVVVPLRISGVDEIAGYAPCPATTGRWWCRRRAKPSSSR